MEHGIGSKRRMRAVAACTPAPGGICCGRLTLSCRGSCLLLVFVMIMLPWAACNVVDWLYGNPPRMMESVHTLLGVGWSEHVLPPSPTLVQAPLKSAE